MASSGNTATEIPNPLQSIDESDLPSEVRILDTRLRKHMSLFRLVLLQSGQYTLFPEMLEVFGEEAVIKFLDIFGGITIRVPDRGVLERAVRDVDIYVTLSKCNTPEVAGDLARKYDVDEGYVRELYAKVANLQEAIGAKVH